jgi:hypothetical protein
MTEGFVADRPEFEWLTEKAGGWQFGEQGILVSLANAINQPGQCVEIGAGDGEELPLTIEPFYNHGLDCVLFEKNSESFAKLAVKFPKAKLCGEFEPKEKAENLMLCVIDVDSIDSYIMEQVLKNEQPQMLMVEHFDQCHERNTDINHRVPEWLLGVKFDGGFTVQDNAETLKAIARSHNYTRLGTTRVNSIFVHDSLVEKVAKHVPG